LCFLLFIFTAAFNSFNFVYSFTVYKPQIIFVYKVIRPVWWKNFPLLMVDSPLYGGRISPPKVEGFPSLLWKEIGNGGRISPEYVEEIPPLSWKNFPPWMDKQAQHCG
jgi:hypothetical protein